VKIGRRVRQGCCLCPILFKLYSEYLTKEALEGVGDIQTVQVRITRQPSSVQIIMDHKQLENVESLKYLGSLIANDARCTLEIKTRVVLAKSAFNKKKFFHQPIGLTFRNKLVKCYIWSIAWYDVETWALRKVDHKYLEKISWADRVKKMKYGEESRRRGISYIKKSLTGFVTYCAVTAF